jgi:hypothetical protein
MASRVYDANHLTLPVRSRIVPAPDCNIPARLSLADRIANLPDVQVVDHESPEGAGIRVDVYLGNREASLRRQPAPRMFCVISAVGIVVHGLADVDRHHVLSRRWGRLHGQGVLLYMPRDEDELEIVWRILDRAYAALVTTAITGRPPRRALVYELPCFSRTNLQ